MSTVSPPPSIFSATTRVDPALPASPSKPTHGIFEHHEHGHEPMRERQEFTDDDLKMQGKVHLRHDVLCAVGEFSGSVSGRQSRRAFVVDVPADAHSFLPRQFIFLLCAFLGAQSALYNRSVGTDGLPPSRNDNEVRRDRCSRRRRRAFDSATDAHARRLSSTSLSLLACHSSASRGCSSGELRLQAGAFPSPMS